MIKREQKWGKSNTKIRKFKHYDDRVFSNSTNTVSSSTIATESRISMLDGRKRSVEDADYCDAIVTPTKK